jgi:hypothetical protein
MDRFSETDSLDLRPVNYRRDGPPEAFYVESLPCEACGQPCDNRAPAAWDSDLLVGECCTEELETPSEPRCPIEYRLLEGPSSVKTINSMVREHRKDCPVCNGQRKGVGREGGRVERREVA